MHNKSKKKIEFLQAYVRKNYAKWFKKYGDNLTSIWIDRKRKGNSVMPYYSIVFNVVKKESPQDLQPAQIFPKHITIQFPDGKKRIKTDVRQTGKFEFHAGIGSRIQDGPAGIPGTLGLILKDAQGNLYALTNYHVAAESFLKKGIIFYDITKGAPAHQVSVNNQPAWLYKGFFNNQIDAALVLLTPGTNANNLLPGPQLSQVNNNSFIQGPLPATATNKTATLYIPSQNGRLSMPVKANSAPLNAGIVFFQDLISFDRCTQGGDSGSVVLIGKNETLGIVLGADDENTFVVPYYKIHKSLPLQIV